MPTSLFIAAKCNYIEKNLKTMKNIIFCAPALARLFWAMFRLFAPAGKHLSSVCHPSKKRGFRRPPLCSEVWCPPERVTVTSVRFGRSVGWWWRSISVLRTNNQQPTGAGRAARRMGENNISCASASAKVRDTHPLMPRMYILGTLFVARKCTYSRSPFPATYWSRSYNFQSK